VSPRITFNAGSTIISTSEGRVLVTAAGNGSGSHDFTRWPNAFTCPRTWFTSFVRVAISIARLRICAR